TDGYAWLRMPAAPFLLAGTTSVALGVVARTALGPALREHPRDLLACYAAAAALARVGWHWGSALFATSSVALAIANVLVVGSSLGSALRPYGMAEAHLVALGLAATLLQIRVARAFARRADLVSILGYASETSAGLI